MSKEKNSVFINDVEWGEIRLKKFNLSQNQERENEWFELEQIELQSLCYWLYV